MLNLPAYSRYLSQLRLEYNKALALPGESSSISIMASDITRKLGGSLQVPVVQELAKQVSGTVPPRYIRPDHDPIISDLSSLPQIPVINMQSLFDEGGLKDSELDKLHSACQEWGFFQVLLVNSYLNNQFFI